jgi:hypothetical protein
MMLLAALKHSHLSIQSNTGIGTENNCSNWKPTLVFMDKQGVDMGPEADQSVVVDRSAVVEAD